MFNKEQIIMGVFEGLSTDKYVQYPIVRLTKIGEGVSPKYPVGHPRHIPSNTVAEGKMLRPVAVGQSFYVNHIDSPHHFHTSVVQEILSDNTFRTMNSIYKWEII